MEIGAVTERYFVCDEEVLATRARWDATLFALELDPLLAQTQLVRSLMILGQVVLCGVSIHFLQFEDRSLFSILMEVIIDDLLWVQL